MVQLEAATITRVLELLVLFSKKAAFQLQEFERVGGLFQRFSKAAEAQEKFEDFPLDDVKIVISTINVCTQRAPVEVQNYRAIADLLDKLTKVVNECEDCEEMKTEL